MIRNILGINRPNKIRKLKIIKQHARRSSKHQSAKDLRVLCSQTKN